MILWLSSILSLTRFVRILSIDFLITLSPIDLTPCYSPTSSLEVPLAPPLLGLYLAILLGLAGSADMDLWMKFSRFDILKPPPMTPGTGLMDWCLKIEELETTLEWR
jgi:hypothetical protein